MSDKRYIRTELSPGLKITAFAGSLIICLAIFSFIPALNYKQFINQTNIKRTFSADVVHQTELNHKKDIPQQSQEMRPDSRSRKSNKKSKTPESSGRFAMDMGPATSLGGRTGGVAMALQGADGQTSYSQGETDTDAKLLRMIPPKYPKAALEAGVHGLVKCLLTIGENGKIIAVSFLETPGEYGFKEVIEEALSQWVFEPATIDGIPVRQKLEQPFKF